MSGGGLRADLQRSEETWELRTDGIEVRWPVEGGPVMGVPRDGGGCWGGGCQQDARLVAVDKAWARCHLKQGRQGHRQVGPGYSATQF
jgi:hypothetical protein